MAPGEWGARPSTMKLRTQRKGQQKETEKEWTEGRTKIRREGHRQSQGI